MRVGALMYGLWLAQNSPKNSWKVKKVDKTRCTWPFQAENRYEVTLANPRAPGVWLLLGFKMYLLLAKKWPGIPDFGKENYFSTPRIELTLIFCWLEGITYWQASRLLTGYYSRLLTGYNIQPGQSWDTVSIFPRFSTSKSDDDHRK